MLRLDPRPQWTEAFGQSFGNPRFIIFSLIITKICIDRVYNLAKIINPNAKLDADGEATLDILEYNHPQTSAEVYDYLDNYGPKGRLAYEALLKYDTGFVLARTIPLCMLLYWAFNRAPQRFRPGIWVPLASMLVDLSENFCLWTLLKSYPQRMMSLAHLATCLMKAKWVMLWAVVGMVGISILVGIYYSMHGMLGDSVLMEKDRHENNMKNRRQVAEVLQRASKKKQ